MSIIDETQNYFHFSYSMQLNDLRKFICLKKSEVSVERISVCNVTEKLA